MRRMLSIVSVALLSTLSSNLLAQAPATQPTEERPVPRAVSSNAALQQKLSEFRADGIALADVINQLAQASGANFYVKWSQLAEVGVDKQTPVSVQLHGVTLAKLLDTILDSVVTGDTKLGYYVHENVITISVSASKRTDLVTRVYDVTDLMINIPDLAPGDYGSNTGGNSTSNSTNTSGSGSRSSGMSSSSSRSKR